MTSHRTDKEIIVDTKKKMELSVQSLDGSTYVIDVGVDDTTEDVRRKVASAAGLSEDSFEMSVGGSGVGDIAITQLSAGDTIFLTPSKKHEAIAMLHALGETDLTAERLKAVTNPEVARLLLQAEVTTVILDDFFLQTHETRLDLSEVGSVVQEVGANFACDSETLTALDVSGLVNVTHLGDNFSYYCTVLKTIDVSGFSRVRDIGGFFLSHCESLTTIDLSALSSVTRIRGFFLSRCENLTALNISGLHNVTHVGDQFLSSCGALVEVDLSVLRSVVNIGVLFLYNCGVLARVNLSGLSSVAVIENCMFSGCTALKAIDVSGSSSVVFDTCETYAAEVRKLGQRVVVLQ